MKLKKAIQLWWYKRKISKLKPKREDATLVYTDSLGNKWYTVSPAALQGTRGLTAWILADDIKYGLTREKILTGFKKITQFHNEGKMAEAAKIVGVMEAALDIYAIPEVLLNVATCYTFLNDEPDDYVAMYQKKKREIWEKDYECKSFFLTYARQYTEKYSESPPEDAQEYFQKMKPIIDQIEHRLK